MNKKILLTLGILTLFTFNSVVKAEESIPQKQQDGVYVEYKGVHRAEMHKFKPSKQEMAKKRAEMEKRLKLTDEQKKQFEENRKLGHEKVRPIIEQKKAKIMELRETNARNTLNKQEKSKKVKELKKEIRQLDEQANAYREENIKQFESNLTDKQKKEFEKIKKEQKKEMEKRKKAFKKDMKRAKREGRLLKEYPPKMKN